MEVSEYSTFRVRLQISDEPAEEQLINLWIGLQALPQIRWLLPNSRRDARPLPVALRLQSVPQATLKASILARRFSSRTLLCSIIGTWTSFCSSFSGPWSSPP